MEKTPEQKIASKNRFEMQKNKAIEKLKTDDLYDYIDGLFYAYSFCMRYHQNLRDLVGSFNPFFTEPKTPLEKCINAGILKDWRDTYWFDKEKAQRLQDHLLEQAVISTLGGDNV